MNMGLIDHPLTPLIVAWLKAVNYRAAYDNRFTQAGEIVARDLLNAALNAELASWQPIDTAPRDRRNVIIAGCYGNGISYVEEGWWNPSGHWNSRKLDPPTHWMPLPAAPARDLLNAALEETK
jgi:hypothetical protein